MSLVAPLQPGSPRECAEKMEKEILGYESELPDDSDLNFLNAMPAEQNRACLSSEGALRAVTYSIEHIPRFLGGFPIGRGFKTALYFGH